MKGAGIAVLILVAIAASFVVGYLAREAGFKLTALSERFTRRTAPPLTASWTRIRDTFGDDFTERLTGLHPILRHLDPGEQGRNDALDRSLPAGGGHQANASLHLFTYSKLWLRGRAPALSVDNTEAEINILVSTILPVLLLAVDATVLSGTPLAIKIIAVPGAVLISLAVMTAVRRLRKTEQAEALRNLAFDFAMREAEAKYPTVERRDDEEAA